MCKGPLSMATAIKEYEDKLYDKSVKGDYRILEIVNEDEPTTKEETKHGKIIIFNSGVFSMANYYFI